MHKRISYSKYRTLLLIFLTSQLASCASNSQPAGTRITELYETGSFEDLGNLTSEDLNYDYEVTWDESGTLISIIENIHALPMPAEDMSKLRTHICSIPSFTELLLNFDCYELPDDTTSYLSAREFDFSPGSLPPLALNKNYDNGNSISIAYMFKAKLDDYENYYMAFDTGASETTLFSYLNDGPTLPYGSNIEEQRQFTTADNKLTAPRPLTESAHLLDLDVLKVKGRFRVKVIDRPLNGSQFPLIGMDIIIRLKSMCLTEEEWTIGMKCDFVESTSIPIYLSNSRTPELHTNVNGEMTRVLLDTGSQYNIAKIVVDEIPGGTMVLGNSEAEPIHLSRDLVYYDVEIGDTTIQLPFHELYITNDSPGHYFSIGMSFLDERRPFELDFTNMTLRLSEKR